jgi:hypothetical protein
MWENKLSLYLRTWKHPFFINPFLDKTFFIIQIETLSEGSEKHLLDDVTITFKEKSMTISFNKIDSVIGTYLTILTLTNNYAYDPDVIITINMEKSDKISPWDKNVSEYFEKTIQKLYNQNLNKNYIKVQYKDENSFMVNKQIIRFKITKYKRDFYYFDKELERWNNPHSNK